MIKRKLPIKGTPEAVEFKHLWDSLDHRGKLALCQFREVSYDYVKHTITSYSNQDLPEPEIPVDMPWAEQIEVFKQMDRLMAIHNQVPSEVTIHIKTDKPIGIVRFADLHLGQQGVDYDSFKKDVLTVKNTDGLKCTMGGDGYHNIIQPSKVGSSHNQIPIAPQRGLFVLTLKELLSPEKKLEVLKTGNHNWWSTMAVGEDWERELARRLNLLYVKHFGVIYWHVGEMVYPELTMHKGRFNSAFNLTHTCKQYQRLHFPKARIVSIEHQHIPAVEQYRYNDEECVAIRTGTYSVYDDFAQQNGYFGSHVSNPTTILFPNEDKIIPFKDMYDAIDHLKYLRSYKE